MRAGCLPRLIGINCARLQSRTESLTLAASQHFFLIVLMITTRADDHCGALIVRRAALRLLPPLSGDESRAVPRPPQRRAMGDAPQGGLGVPQDGLEGSHVARAPNTTPPGDTARQLSAMGTGRRGEGTAAPCPPGGASSSCPISWLCPIGERWLRGGHQEGECPPP